MIGWILLCILLAGVFAVLVAGMASTYRSLAKGFWVTTGITAGVVAFCSAMYFADYLQAMCKQCKATKEKLRRDSDPDYRRRLRARNLACHRLQQAESLETARNSTTEWTGADLEIALREDLSAIEAAKLVGRTIAAVKWQRHIHTKDPRKQALAGLVRSEL